MLRSLSFRRYPLFFFLLTPQPPRSTLFPYTTLFRSYRDYFSSVQCRRDRPWPERCRCRPTTLWPRSEEHTSELQSRPHLVCRLLLEKKKQNTINITF